MEGYRTIIEHLLDYADLFYLAEDGEETPERFLKKRGEIEDREKLGGIFLPAVYLRNCYGLSMVEFLMLMYGAVCEVEGGLSLLQPDYRHVLHILSAVEPIDALLPASLCDPRSVLWELFVPAREKEGSVLGQPICVRRAALHFLLSGGMCPPQGAEIFPPGDICAAADIRIPEQNRLCRLFELPQVTVRLEGRAGSGRKTLLRQACQKSGRYMILIRLSSCGVNLEDGAESTELQRNLLFWGRILNPVFAVDFGGTEQEDAKAAADMMKQNITRWPLVFLPDMENGNGGLYEEADISIQQTAFVNREERKALLDTLIAGEYRFGWQEDLLCGYRFTVGELVKKIREISIASLLANATPAQKDVWREILMESEEQDVCGQVIRPVYRQEDLVCGKECGEQLKKVILLAKNWRKHIEEWRMEDAALQGSFVVLFYGASGTGKTMSASVLASELGMSLFKVDLSGVLDKYIGETEKHLEKIFRMASRGNYVLFFDEADVLFSKRTDIRNANDKYANVSTAYLLQRIEEFDGIVILATNLRDHFDDAFLRRIRYVVTFKNLEKTERGLLWRKALGDSRTAEGDISSMGLEEIPLSPARIKAAALTARMLAAEEGNGEVRFKHIREAVFLEAAKDETVLSAARWDSTGSS